jgi:hypothetical protein
MFSNEGLGVKGRIGGQQKGQEGMTAVPRAGDGYGPAEHRLMGYEKERLKCKGAASTHPNHSYLPRSRYDEKKVKVATSLLISSPC